MKFAVPKEIHAGENRVAMTPDVAKKLCKAGYIVHIEAGAGDGASFTDADYEAAGCTIEKDAASVFKGADVLAKIHAPEESEIGMLEKSTVLLAMLSPLFEPARAKTIAETGCLSFSFDAIPRISRSQSMDVLSSQANITGYKAVLMAADRLPKLMPMLMTAAGTISPAKCFVLGAGVAGLQAIATARRLGAVVEAFDVRPVVKEQVQSLGAKFVEIDLGESGEGKGGYAKELSEEAKQKQRDALNKIAAGMDIIITTAAIPGRTAPRLIDKSAIEKMRPGSVVIDLAAATGGNVEGSKPDEDVTIGKATVLGPTNLASLMPKDASQMYAKNVVALFELMMRDDAKIDFDWDDQILQESVITKDGEVVHEGTKAKLSS